MLCGYDNPDALCLDHIHNDGAAWRTRHNIGGMAAGGRRSGRHTPEVLKRLRWPIGFQTLCANCNLIKELERKRCQR